MASDDEQDREARKLCDDVLGDPIAEILLLRVSAHVGEGEDGNGGFVWKFRK